MHRFSLWLVAAILSVTTVNAFYLPGVAPKDFEEGQKVPLLVNALTSSLIAPPNDDEQYSLVSYDYYFHAFKFCLPANGEINPVGESLGSILFGDRIFNSPFELEMRKDESCKKLCDKPVKYNSKDAAFVARRIAQGFVQNWLIDGLPAASQLVDVQNNETFYVPGFPLGYQEENSKYALNNHYSIEVEYHKTWNGKYRVVGVSVFPSSRDYLSGGANLDQFTCNATGPIYLDTSQSSTEVQFSYSVKWVESSTPWATRWDRYLHVESPKIHWLTIINSIVAVVILVSIVATVFLRTVRKDIAQYNEVDLSDDIQEDSGWKLVHGDVFRNPPHAMLLSVVLGSGAQIFCMAFSTLMFAAFGLLSPSSRGALTTCMIILFCLYSCVGGYVSARLYKTFDGKSLKLNLILTPLIVPGGIFGFVVLLNFFLIFANSSGAVPFGTMIALVFIWFVLSVPFSVAAGFLGFRNGGLKPPVRVHQIPRQIPPQPTSLRLIPSMLIAGIMPFCAISAELYFIMNSLWFHKVYYMFGFLFICFFLMIVIACTVTVLMVYFMLCAENYNWQWRSFLIGGSSSIYIFLHSLVYLVTKLKLTDATSIILYLGYSALITSVCGLLTGSMAFLSTLLFTRSIYTSIKVD